MDELDLFRIADTYTLTVAAALIVGVKPSRIRRPNRQTIRRFHLARLERKDAGADEIDDAPDAFNAALQSLTHAVERGSLPATKCYRGVDPDILIELSLIHEHKDGVEIVGEIDLSKTTVAADDLKSWLSSRGVKSGFFFPESSQTPAYLDRNHARFSPKLAAAVKVWLAMEDENLRRSRGVVAAIKSWLKSRYDELELFHEQDSTKNGVKVKAREMNNTAIEEISKVANWRPKGGAVRTPGE
ncbi:hypothetical protein AWB79_01268 [Caballeronia hypogeia]|uniref:Uncharacterized protein n=1 Tax=Caballeronia hypogeia TaxID=1777140 RepID=A0A157ZRT0_9BURK|nr:hypothetical protein [Caballeronia hypogeia]SAK48244.1 hypothetical protein AWB79_01268 [Caballeronia hypogeia]